MTPFGCHRFHSDSSSGFALLFAAAILLVPSAFGSTPSPTSKTTKPFRVESMLENSNGIAIGLNGGSYEEIRNGNKLQVITVPISINRELRLDLEKFEVIRPGAKFVIGTPSGNIPTSVPDVVLMRGKVQGDNNSHVYLSITSKGFANGYINTNGLTHFIAHKPGEENSTVSTYQGGAELPPFAELCGVLDGTPAGITADNARRGAATTNKGPIISVIGFDADHRYYNIFGNVPDAQNYLIQLLGAVSDIYLRDFNMILSLGFMRVWSVGEVPFDQNDLGAFQDYWNNNEDTSGLDIIHLITARRDLGFGGIAYVSAYCSDFRYSISGFVNGSFPTPFGEPSNSNWDVIVMAHELGHNYGTLHTHDISQYDPRIDSCAFDFPSRGTIMSYCHIHPGYTANIDPSFPGRVQNIVELDVTNGIDCFFHDCNGNGIDDLTDIFVNLSSADINLDSIPDECQDCNGNSILDPVDILGASDDVNSNGIPDECETDCDGNGIPDEWEASYFTNDINDNLILDECEPDCNSNSIADFIEIANGTLDDFDRNNIPDICQDCNSNSIPDWLDLEREFNLFVADRLGGIHEYHARSGYPIQNLDSDNLYYDVEIGNDRKVYGTLSSGTITKVDPVSGFVSEFWVSPVGGIHYITLGPDGNFYISIKNNSSVRKINGSTGADLGIFVTAGSGGLNGPSDLVFGPNGNLFVASENNNSVNQYNGTTGAYISTFVLSGSGGLTTPKGLVFKNDGKLLVTSYGTSKVYEYDGSTGAFIRQFNDENDPEQPWGITIGHTGNVFTARTQDQGFQVFENLPGPGRYYRSFVRRDFALQQPGGIAFMPISQFDCDGNYVIDECEGPASACCCEGIRGDANGDGTDCNILDLTFVVDYIFRGSGNAGPCLGESDVNGDSSIGPNILDLTFTVDRIFRGGPPPGACAK